MKLGVGLVVLATACGSVSEKQPDARTADAPAELTPDAIQRRCDPAKPFGAPVALSAVNTAMEDGGAHLTEDELTMYLSTRPANTSQIYVATRSSVQAAFSTPSTVANVNIGDNFSPSLTSDGRTMYLISNGTGTLGGHDVFVTTRASATAAFDAPSDVTPVNSTDDGEYSVSVTGIGDEIYFSSGRSGKLRLYKATKSGGTVGAPAIVNEIVEATADDHLATVRADGLELYFSSNRSGTLGGYDVWVSRRASVTAAFGTPVHVGELSTAQDDGPTWVSPDGCHILLVSNRTGGKGNTDIWYAERPM